MMDAQTLLSDAQALTATAVSTNSYDKGAAGNDIANGQPLGIEITVDVAADFTSANETYVFSRPGVADKKPTFNSSVYSKTAKGTNGVNFKTDFEDFVTGAAEFRWREKTFYSGRHQIAYTVGPGAWVQVRPASDLSGRMDLDRVPAMMGN